jgi:hypothetical protein
MAEKTRSAEIADRYFKAELETIPELTPKAKEEVTKVVDKATQEAVKQAAYMDDKTFSVWSALLSVLL